MNRFVSMIGVCAVVILISDWSGGRSPAAAMAFQGQDKPKIPDRVYVRMETSLGDLVLELNQEKAPITVKNFLEYADSGSYNDTIFHRVIDRFMIQGGGFDTAGKKKETRSAIKNEWRNGLKNAVGTIAMARLGGNPDSATSQFFINVVDNSRLDRPQRDGAAYCVFGKVIDGMSIVNKIKGVQCENRGGAFANAPVENVVIEKVTRVGSKDIKDIIAAARAAEKEAKMKAQQAEAEAKMKAQQATAKEWPTAMDFIKSRGADPSKGGKSSTGLWHVDLVAGTGASPKPTDRVKVHYTGWLVSGKKFDSSLDRGEPISFPLNRVIKGWTEGVGSMKVGGKRLLVIPSPLGYGARGSGSSIPPNATLIFEVELLGINE